MRAHEIDLFEQARERRMAEREIANSPRNELRSAGRWIGGMLILWLAATYLFWRFCHG